MIFLFWPEIPFSLKFGPKNQNCQCKLKFGTYTNSNMQNSMVIFIFFCFQSEMVFWANLVQKFKIIERETWYLNGNENKTFQEEYAQIYFIHFITKNFRYHSINFTIINYFTSWCLHFQSSCKSTRQWEIYSKLTKTREQLHWNHSCDFGFNVRQNGCSQIFDQNNWH